MIVNVEILDLPGERRRAPSAASSKSSATPDDFGVDVEIIIRKHHLPHRFPRRSARAGAASRRRHPAPTSSPAAATSAHSTSSPSTAKPRAISTTPSGWTACPTATTPSTSTSPTSATTCAPARPSTTRRACAAPASTSPTAPCPCCRSSSPPNLLAEARRWTAWCCPRCSKSTIAATSSRRSSPAA